MRFVFCGYELVLRRVESPPPVSVPAPVKVEAEKPKPVRIRKCPTMDKRMFTREQAAEEAKLTKAPYIRIYCCEFCGTWHLTSKKVHKF